MTDSSKAPFAFDGLDRVIHEKARLGIMTSLISHRDGLAFGDLKKLCDLTDGNLSRHLSVLQEAGLISVKKGYLDNKPHTTCALTAKGKKQFLKYLEVLERIVENANATANTSNKPAKKPA
jgi:DNA-binding HxlR family transcriptional regulator